jgi:beta-glucosidase
MSDQLDNTSEGPYEFPFQDPDLPTETRIDNLISLLTTEEKVLCLSTNPSIPRLLVRGSGHVEGLHGLALGGPGSWGKDYPITTTTFPQAIGMASTWDPEIVEKMAAAEAYEARYAFQHPAYNRGGLVVRAPNADLGRDPRWGRTEECYGEDPYLNGTLASAYVRGLQGPHPKYWCAAALLKHFLANSNEDEREYSSSDFDERLFHEYYAVPFRMAIVAAGSRAFMAAYNKHNGIPCTTHPVLKNIAVSEWQQDGIICTDGGAFKLLVNKHKYYPDLYQAAAACIRAGITQFLDDFQESILGALERELLSVSEIEAAIRGNFRVMIRLGLLDPKGRVPYATIGDDGEKEPWLREDHKSLVRHATCESIVLLKNAGGLLPLKAESIKSVVMVGALADRVLLDWYSGSLPYAITPIDGLRERLAGTQVQVNTVTGNDKSEAVRRARQADVAILCVGNHPTGDAGWARVGRDSYGKEAVDRKSVELEDEALIKAVFAANPNTIVVLVSSFPYAIEWTNDNVPAIVHMTHNSQEMGHALADVIFGDYNPGGRLVQTWFRSTAQLAPRLDYDIRCGHTYLYSEHQPLYPFGFGLSYTSFSYDKLRVSPTLASDEAPIKVEVDVKNTGTRSGDEVVQLYVRHVESAVPRPIKELKGFRRVNLLPGQTRTISFELPLSHLAYWNAADRCFSVEKGQVEILIARNSAQPELKAAVTIARDYAV